MLSLQYLQYACIRAIVNTSLYVRRSPWMSPATQPDRIKMYAYRPDLFPSRIFTPRTHAGQQLPLVVCVHGGGFIFNNPAVDDPLACHLADISNCIVVSIDYRKSPQKKSLWPMTTSLNYHSRKERGRREGTVPQHLLTYGGGGDVAQQRGRDFHQPSCHRARLGYDPAEGLGRP